ncbi:MAG: type I-C CRISPR-associated protein Cas8c/Csd1 [Dehalococcoidia bacterium]
MFRELVIASDRFRTDDEMGPVAYKQKAVNWIIELGGKQPHVSGRFTPGELRRVFAPDRYRSGKRSGLKPFLLFETAEVLFSMGKDMKPVHEAYVRLLEEATGRAADAQERAEVAAILDFLGKPPPAKTKKMKAKDLVALRVDPLVFPFERPGIQRFWAEHLESELSSKYPTVCVVCANKGQVVRTFPRPLVLFGQKCQVTSFDDPAFRSFGRRQTENSPICFRCASTIIDTLDFLVAGQNKNHRSEIVRKRVRPNGPPDPFRSQLAVYWLSHPVELQERGAVISEEALRAVLAEDFRSDEGEPLQADIQHVENLLKLPWAPRDAGLTLDTERFHLAVLSANKGRLVVREWFSVSLADLQERLRRFLGGLRLVSPWGGEPRAVSIAAIVAALHSQDPHLTRGLLRAAYLGQSLPGQLVTATASRLRVLWTQGARAKSAEEEERVRHIAALTAAAKLALTHGREDASQMEMLDPEHLNPGYLCGQLLAVLAEAQRRAADGKLNTTLVERYYGAASVAPASVFSHMLALAQVAHLPKLRRKQRGYGELNRLLEDIHQKLKNSTGGFPPYLSPPDQCEFALGFYCQRAEFHKHAGSRGASQ